MSTQALSARPAHKRGAQALDALRNPLYRSGYALVANTVGTTVIGVAYWAVAAHLYSQQALGRSSALVSMLILVSSFAQLNLGNTLPRFLPQTGRRAGRLIAYSYGVSSAAALAIASAFVVVLPQLSPRWQFLGHSPLLALAFVAAAVVWGIFSLQDAALLSVRRPVVVPVENTVYGVGKLLLLVGIAAVLPAAGIFVSWVIPLVVIVPAVNWLIFRRYLTDRDTANDVATVRARDVVRFASLDYLGAILGQTYGNLLPLLVLSTLGAAANGDFYIAWTIAAGLAMVVSNFATSLLVEAAAAPERLAELTRGVLARCAVVAVPGVALLVLAARLILSIYGHSYAVHASVLLGLLAVATIPNTLVTVTLSLDRIAGRVGRPAVTRLALAVLVLGGSSLMLRRLGIDAVGFAWTGANLIVAVARLPTILGTARRRAYPVPAPTAAGASAEAGVPAAAGLPRTRSTSSGRGLHRRPPAGRHRVGAHQPPRAEMSGRPPRRPAGPPTRTWTPS